MRKIFLTFFVIGLPWMVLSCASPTDSTGASGSASGSSPTVVTPPQATEDSPLKLRIYTKYDQTEATISQTFLETGTTNCEATDAAPIVTCTIKIPEARLYYSNMTFTYSWRNDKCKLMTFQPYYYRASIGSFLPPWSESAIDCTKVPAPATCWGGAAPHLVDTFPKNKAIIYLSDPSSSTAVQQQKILVSGYSLNYGSNRLTATDLAIANRGGNIAFANGDNYLANTFQDYVFSCRDDWYDPQIYQITLQVEDENSYPPANVDHIGTWQ